MRSLWHRCIHIPHSVTTVSFKTALTQVILVPKLHIPILLSSNCWENFFYYNTYRGNHMNINLYPCGSSVFFSHVIVNKRCWFFWRENHGTQRKTLWARWETTTNKPTYGTRIESSLHTGRRQGLTPRDPFTPNVKVITSGKNVVWQGPFY